MHCILFDPDTLTFITYFQTNVIAIYLTPNIAIVYDPHNDQAWIEITIASITRQLDIDPTDAISFIHHILNLTNVVTCYN